MQFSPKARLVRFRVAAQRHNASTYLRREMEQSTSRHCLGSPQLPAVRGVLSTYSFQMTNLHQAPWRSLTRSLLSSRGSLRCQFHHWNQKVGKVISSMVREAHIHGSSLSLRMCIAHCTLRLCRNNTRQRIHQSARHTKCRPDRSVLLST